MTLNINNIISITINSYFNNINVKIVLSNSVPNLLYTSILIIIVCCSCLLDIDKATSSLLVSISYAAIVLFMLFTPFVVKKMGTVGTICFTVLLSIPFMLIIANGNHFGKAMIPMVGIGLFMRAGLANLGSPADSSLSMMLAPKNLRPAFISVVNFIAGIVSIISGHFTGSILFTTQEGYRTAYYIAAALYFVAALVIITLFKKYNRKEAEE